ncbi:MAG: hypothetical protein JXQ76_02310 [Campylobacterales bacterium]|nr:hypothetical protein [Campylobacterales bacterium]
MKIKYNNFLIIIPVFLLLGVVLAFFNLFIEKRELTWGVNSELKATLVATTIYLENNKDMNSTKMEQTFQKIKDHNRIKRIVLIREGEPTIEVRDDKLKAYSKHNDRGTKVEDNIFKSEIYQYNELSLIDAHIDIKDTNTTLIMTFNVSDLQDRVEQEYQEAILTVIIITFIGFLTSILLSMLVINKIKLLSSMTQALIQGKYNLKFKTGIVKEFSDLGATLNIMKSILQEVLLKIKNSIVQEELLAKDSSLVEFYRQSSHQQNYLQSSNISLIIKTPTNDHVSFFNIFENDHFIYTYFGKISHEDESNLSSVSINYYLERVLKNKKSINFDLITQYYHLESLTLAVVDKKRAKVTIQRLNEKESSFKLNYNKRDIVYASSNIDAQSKQRIANYIANYSNLSLEDLSSDIALYDTNNIFMLISKVKS